MSDPDPTCALWYMSHGAPGYTLYDDEESAAAAAVYMADDGDHAFPQGVQFSDGTYTPLEEWATYKAEDDRLMEDALAKVRATASQRRPATRKIRPPFDTRYDSTVTVKSDAPSWLGR